MLLLAPVQWMDIGTGLLALAVGPAASARVNLNNNIDNDNVGLAAAWGPAGNLVTFPT